MSDFLYLYRLPANSPHTPGSPHQLQERLQKWTTWFKDLDAKGKIKTLGHPLASSGAVVKDKKGSVQDGPYAESKDLIIGYTLVEAKDLAEASALAAGCPVLESGGQVEVRPVQEM